MSLREVEQLAIDLCDDDMARASQVRSPSEPRAPRRKATLHSDFPCHEGNMTPSEHVPSSMECPCDKREICVALALC